MGIQAEEQTSIHWVTPKLPTSLDDHKYLPIPATDMVPSTIQTLWVLPGSLDVSKLQGAIATALSAFPHAAGRLRRTGGWRILLTNSPVPLTVTTSVLDIDNTSMQEPHPEVVDRIVWDWDPSKGSDEPLVRFKVVTYGDSTSTSTFSVNFDHLLGDGNTMFRFIHLISQSYQGLSPAFEPPTYEKFLRPIPIVSDQVAEETFADVPHLVRDYDMGTFSSMLNEAMESTSRVDLEFTIEELNKIKAMASRSVDTEITMSDAIAAYLITTVNRCLPKEKRIKSIQNVIDYRGVPGCSPNHDWKVPSQTAAGNITIIKQSICMSDSDALDTGRVALCVRETVRETRNFDFIHRCIATSERLYKKTADAGRSQWWWPPVNGAAINNNYKIKWTSAHFGYDGRVSYHIFGAWPYFLRIFSGNPIRLQDSTWLPNKDGARVFFRVEHAILDTFLQTIQKDRETLPNGAAQVA